MSLEISNVVQTSILVSPLGITAGGFGSTLLLTNETGIIPRYERVRSYTSTTTVSADWSSSTKVFAAATAYFSQTPRPNSLKVGVRYTTAQPGQLVGGSISSADITALTAILDASFTVSFDGVSSDYTGIDLSTATTGAEIATLLSTAVAPNVVSFENNRFIFTSATTGASSSVSNLSAAASGTDISELLGGTVESALVVVPGIDAETVEDALAAIQLIDSDFRIVTTTREVRDTQSALDLAAWAQTRDLVYITTTNDADTLSAVSTSDTASLLQDGAYSHTVCVYSSSVAQYPDMSIAGRIATIDFDGNLTSITLAFKNLPTITAESLTQSQNDVLEAKNCNRFVTVAGVNILLSGKGSGGDFFDNTYQFEIWLKSQINVALFNVIYTQATKLAYTAPDLLKIRSAIEQVLLKSVRNGMVGPGNDENGVLLDTGYRIDMPNLNGIPAADKEQRVLNGISITAISTGAIHKITTQLSYVR